MGLGLALGIVRPNPPTLTLTAARVLHGGALPLEAGRELQAHGQRLARRALRVGDRGHRVAAAVAHAHAERGGAHRLGEGADEGAGAGAGAGEG